MIWKYRIYITNGLLNSVNDVPGNKIYIIAIVDKNGKVLRLKIGYTTRNIYERMREILKEC